MTRYTLVCRAEDSQGKPIAGLHIEIFDANPAAPEDPLDKPQTTDNDGFATFRFYSSDIATDPPQPEPDLSFKVYRNETYLDYKLPIADGGKVIHHFRPQREPFTLQIEKHYVVAGIVVQDNGLPADETELSIQNLTFTGNENIELGLTKTDFQGHYSLAYNPGNGVVNLQIKLKADSQPLAAPRFGAGAFETIHLVIPAASLEPEYDRLHKALKPHLGNKSLLDAKETNTEHDITLLSQLSGWDARLIAMARVSLELSNSLKLPEKIVYGLLRMGLPSDAQLLAQVASDTIAQMLKKSRDAGIVQLDDNEITDFKDKQFAEFRKEQTLNTPVPGSQSTYHDFISSSGLDNDDQQRFTSVYISHNGDLGQLWDKAKNDAGLTDKQIADLKLQGKLALLTSNSARMTQGLQGTGLDDPAKLAEKGFHSADKWKTEILEQAQAGLSTKDFNTLTDEERKKLEEIIPVAYTGKNLLTRLQAYADDMGRKIRLGYPTHVISQVLASKTEIDLGADHTDTVNQLKEAINQGFRFGETPAVGFFQKTMHFDENQLKEPAIQNIKMLQRVYQMTPSNEAMSVLIGLGITSAHAVAAYPASQFQKKFEEKYRDKYGQLPPATTAALINRKAQQISNAVYHISTMFRQFNSMPTMFAVSATLDEHEKKRQEILKHYPTMETLFGSMDFCECEHCRSVLSPAAYLVDLLQFIESQKEGANDKTPYDKLVERRPDLPHILLTCENTHTELPYIDLVNEVLEYYVANDKLDEKAAHDTGETTSPELLAEPQNIIPEAYHKLCKAIYPLSLPFDLWLETVRQVCNYFETSLVHILETFKRSDKPLDRLDILKEYLNLSHEEFGHFVDPDLLSKWYALYGFDQNAIAIDEGQRHVDLNLAKDLSRRLGITYQELTEIIQTYFVNPRQELKLVYDPGMICNFDRARIAYTVGSEKLTLLRINLFVRLWRKLGWSIAKTDLALKILSSPNTPFDASHLDKQPLNSILIHLAYIKILEDKLKIGKQKHDNLLVLWSDEALDNSGSSSAIQDSFKLTADDIRNILEDNHKSLESVPIKENTLLLYRYGLLAKALKLTIRDLIAIKHISGVDPFKPLSPTSPEKWQQDYPLIQTLNFIQIIETIRASNIKIDDIDYLLRHHDATGKYQQKNQTSLMMLKTLAANIQAIRDEQNSSDKSDLNNEMVRQLVIQALAAQHNADPVIVESLLTDSRLLAKQLLVPTPPSIPRREPFQPPTAIPPRPLLTPPATTEMKRIALLNTFEQVATHGITATFWKTDDLKVNPLTMVIADADTGVKDLAGKPLKPVGAQSVRFEGYLEVPATGAYRFYIKLDKQDSTAKLSFPHLPNPVFLEGNATTDNTILGEQSDKFIELTAGLLYRFSLEITRLNNGEARLSVQGETLAKGALSQLVLYPATIMDAALQADILLSKTLQLIQTLGLTERETRYLLINAKDFGNINPSDLPTQFNETTSVAPLFKWLQRLLAYIQLKQKLANGTDELIRIFETKTPDKCIPLLVNLTGCDKDTIAAAVAALEEPSPDFTNEQPLQRIWAILKMVSRLRVSVGDMLKWTKIVDPALAPEDRAKIVQDMKEILNARFGNADWWRIAQPIFNKLRQQQRDALVSHVMHTEPFDQVENLYEYFLLDPAMEPVVKTSRIRLAISSVQLFIQRCLLNLEKDIHPSAINAAHWEWMKRYRVWEANRKIFLFPENWLEPEFRDDKTHLFQELEGELLQGDVSADLVEDALINYLRKLDEIARLDIIAMHREDNGDDQQHTLHVFGRTFNQPHKYFYRRLAHSRWTNWEPISAAIEGDHLAPVVWRSRLYLFWVTFLEKPVPPSTSTDPIDLQKPIPLPSMLKNIEAHLHWSEYLHGKWSTQESSGINAPNYVVAGNVNSDFHHESISLHVTKEYSANNVEQGVFIHMEGTISHTFYLVGRNGIPELRHIDSHLFNPFNTANTIDANRYTGSGELNVSYPHLVSKASDSTQSSTPLTVLQQGGSYKILPCNNKLPSKELSQNARNLTEVGFYTTDFLRIRTSEQPTSESPQFMKYFGYTNDAGAWRVEQHPRFLADLTGDGKADIVGFYKDGVHVSLNNGDGTFQTPKLVIPKNFGFGQDAGNWEIDKHPRFLADLTGDGTADIVGFGDGGVYIALNKGDGTFNTVKELEGQFGADATAGTWEAVKNPRFLADLTGDGKADIVGFGDSGVHVALNKGDGTFNTMKWGLKDQFGAKAEAGTWEVAKHPRFLADLTGDGKADIVGFGDSGVHVALNKGDGTFNTMGWGLKGHFGANADAGKWEVAKHPRFLADLTGDGKADIVGFYNDGVYVALNKGDGTFQEPKRVLSEFGHDTKGWRVNEHPRLLADLTGDGKADIVGFSSGGVYVALNKGDGTFHPGQLVIPNNFGIGNKSGNWEVAKHPRFLADLTGDGRADIVGFYNDGVLASFAADLITSFEPLLKPVFYQDNNHTFFVEPYFSTQTINMESVPYITNNIASRFTTFDPNIVAARGSQSLLPVDPRMDDFINALPIDWLLNPTIAYSIDGTLLGSNGKLDLQGTRNISPGRPIQENDFNIIDKNGITSSLTMNRTPTASSNSGLANNLLTNNNISRMSKEKIS